jgi:ABC-type antimicrobial peptide transport system permease subunit
MPSPRVEAIQDSLAEWLGPQRFALTLFGWFGLLGVTVAVVAVAAMVASLVAERAREIAIRAALGGSHAQAYGLMIRRSAGPVAAGCFLGLVLAFLASAATRAFLVEVDPLDISTFIASAALMIGGTTLVAVLVARRALVGEPMETLRAE